MVVEFTYINARKHFAPLLKRVTKDREVIIVRRRNEEPVAMIAADELAALTETAYLLRSPKNAERFLSALGRALKDEGETISLADLREKVGFDGKEA